MTTYLFIGLILLLAAYLVRRRRARAGDDASTAPNSRRPPLRPPRKARAPVPQPAPARAETAAAAPMAREPLTPASREPLTAPRPAAPAAEPALGWAPEDTIVEPGWPLPGEIAGGWAATPAASFDPSPFPDGAAAPMAVLEWEPRTPAGPAPVDAAEAPAPAADLPQAEEWAMPSFGAPAPAPADDAPSGPPLWVPGEAEVPSPPSSPGDPDQPLWGDAGSPDAVAGEQSAATAWAPAPLDAPPAIAWGPPPPLDETGRDDAPAVAAGDAMPGAGLVWADEATPPAAAEDAPSIWQTDAPQAPSPPEPAEEATAPDAATRIPVETEALPEPAAIVEWQMPAEAEEAVPAVEPVLPVAPSDPGEPAASAFGPLTPAPAWPPGSVPALPDPVGGPDADAPWTASPPSPASPPLEGVVPFTRVCDRLGVTPRMLVLMRMLAGTPRSVTEQARELGVSRPLVADLCTRLENAGLVRREPVATDRRRVRIVLTGAGRRLCDETAGTPGADSLETLVERLSPADRARLLSRLRAEDDPTA